MPQITKQALVDILENKDIAAFLRITGYPVIHKLRRLARAFPEQRQQLFEFITRTPEEFQRITMGVVGYSELTKLTKLSELAEAFPEQRQQLFEFITRTPEEFQRITMGAVGNSELTKLSELARAFPEQFAELGLIIDNNLTADSVFEARWQRLYEANKGDIVQAAKVLDQGNRTPTSILSKLPGDGSATAIIASFLGEHQLPKHVEEEKDLPNVLAYRNLKKHKPVGSPSATGPKFFKAPRDGEGETDLNVPKPKK